MKTLTVGIPAFNEEANIGALINTLTKQRAENFVLEKIVVVSDGSSDRTEVIVTELKKVIPILELVADGQRVGKSQRLNQLYQRNKSEILVTLDGDTALADNSVLEKLVEAFDSDSVVLVGGNKKPVKATTFTEQL